MFILSTDSRHIQKTYERSGLMVQTSAFLDAVKGCGMTMKGVAKKMGISYNSLYRKARNMTPIRISEIEMFCKIAGVSTKAKKDGIFLPCESTECGHER